MDDVAQRAGVSKSSVSRVLNSVSGTVTPETTRRVLDAMDELGYVPNAVAASLKYRRTLTVGLILADLGNPFFALVVTGLEQTFREAGYRLLVTSSGGDHEHEVEQTQLLIEQQVDALLVATSALSGEHIERVVARGIPAMFIDSCLDEPRLDSVLTDNEAGARAVAAHLADLGHRNIAIVRGLPADSSSTERVDGALAELSERGIDVPPEMVFYGDCAVPGGHDAAMRALRLDPLPTALFVTNNLMTVGAMRAIAELGLRIPDDLSLAAFDDMDWFPIADPPITAVAQSALDIGREAAQRMLARLRGDGPASTKPSTIRLPAKLIVRGSTAPVSESDPKAAR